MAASESINIPPMELIPIDPKEQWLAERKTFIGGSEIYKLLNEKQYGQGCVRALAYDKLNVPPDYPDQDDDPELQRILERGNILEPVVAEMYASETGRKLRRPNLNEYGLPKPRIHPEFPWAGVHADRIVLAGSGGVEETGTAEIKTRDKGPFLQVLRSGLFPGDVLQIQHGMFVNNHTWGPFVTLGVFGGLPVKHFDVKRDDGAIEMIKRAGEQFAETVFVKEHIPERPFPADDDRCKVCAWRMECRGEELDKAAAAAFKAEKKGEVALVQIENAELSQALADRDLLKDQLHTISNPEPTKARPDPGPLELVETRIKELLGEKQAVWVIGYGKVYHKFQAGRTNVKITELLKYLNDLAWQAHGIAEQLETSSGPEIIGQAMVVLNELAEVPTTVARQYATTGEAFKVLRTYPAKM